MTARKGEVKSLRINRFVAAMMVCSTLLLASLAQAQSHPNVVIILAEGLGWGDVGYNGGAIPTPAIDELIGSGVALDRLYVSPLGSPTRAGLMTGRHPVRLGLTYSDIAAWDNVGVHPIEHFMPETFKQAGYQTALIGAWGLGHAQETYHPNRRGFDDFAGQLLLGSGLNAPYHNMGGVDLQHNGRGLDISGAYLPEWMGERASSLLRERDQSTPLFLLLSFPSARDAQDAPAGAAGRCPWDGNAAFPDYPGDKTACAAFAASITATDHSIGKVLETLAAEGMSDNTIVLLMSDSGSAIGGGQYRGRRGQVLEGGIHVPAALVWPGQLTAGSRFGSIVTMMDVFPTLASAAGVPPGNERKFDGIDLWSAISTGKSVERKQPVVLMSEAEQYGNFELTAFDDHWKLVQKVQVDLVYIDLQNALYRNTEGVNEDNDLSRQHSGEVKRLEGAIKSLRQQHPINGLRNNMVPPPGWRGPREWAQYTIGMDLLQDVTAAGSPPPFARRPLDFELGEKGRLIYDCEIKWWSLGICIKNGEEDILVYDFHKEK